MHNTIMYTLVISQFNFKIHLQKGKKTLKNFMRFSFHKCKANMVFLFLLRFFLTHAKLTRARHTFVWMAGESEERTRYLLPRFE